MKAQSLVAVALVLVAFAGVAQAGTGPTSPLYLTTFGDNILVVQGNSMYSFPAVYNAPWERPIAVWGDVRTTGLEADRPLGGQYTLAGTPTGTSYVLPSIISDTQDSTSDGSHNYLVDYISGTVYQTARDFTNPVALFTVTGTDPFGITYDAANHSLWISGWADSTVADYSLNGTLLSSFFIGHPYNGALALDPADQTLWLVYYFTGGLEQYSKSGVLLSTGPDFGYAYGGEFDLFTPEPGTLIMFGSGILGLAGVLRRKINL